MKPYYQDLGAELYCMDFRNNDLPDESVQMVCTSPPYWGLRKYSGEQELIWGKQDCEHVWGDDIPRAGYRSSDTNPGQLQSIATQNRNIGHSNFCSLCGAWKGALGLEPEPSMYINHIVEIFREVKRVLRPDGVCFINCGDSYYASGGAHKAEHANPGISKSAQRGGVPREGQSGKRGKALSGLKGYDSSSESPCDECAKIRLLRTTGMTDGLSQVSGTSGVVSSHSHKVSKPDHQDNLGLASQGDRNEGETSGLCSSPDSPAGVAPFSQESTSPESSELLQGECLPKGDWFSSPDVLASLSLVFRECGHRKACPFFAQTFDGVSLESLVEAGNKLGIVLIDDASASHTQDKAYDFSVPYPYYTIEHHLKAKDLCLIPQHLAIAFQRDGWWVRSVIIWAKPNPMPESVTDRPTESHEYILMLTKSARYYWDADAVRMPIAESTIGRGPVDFGGAKGRDYQPTADDPQYRGGNEQWGRTYHYNGGGRNVRTVWEFPTQPYPEAHFAVFPEKLPELCIKAATPEAGCCSKCGAPWERIVEKEEVQLRPKSSSIRGDSPSSNAYFGQAQRGSMAVKVDTLGWQPTCKCNAGKVPSVCLDPFSGAGTTLWVAKKLGRKAVGFDISEEYCKLALERNRQQVLDFSEIKRG